jgi:prefoldin subunit 5
MPSTIKDTYAQALHIESVLHRIETQITLMKELQEFVRHAVHPSHIKVSPGVYYDLSKRVFVVNVGNSYYVEQTTSQVSEYLSQQLSLQTEYAQSLVNKLDSLETEARKHV